MQASELRARTLHAAVELFLVNGYNGTYIDQIAEKVGRTRASILRVYSDKETILHALVVHMFGSQFDNVRNFLGEDADPLLVYGVETALQLHICEMSPALRDVYVSAYTLPSTRKYIYRNTAKELLNIFGDYMPGLTESDFYELEIASGGVMGSYMAIECDMYFPIERKLRLFLQSCFRIYRVPEEKQEAVIGQVLAMNIAAMAKKIIQQTVAQAEAGFDAEMLAAKRDE